ncbi:pkinase-domain-containing protein [Mucor ambiguus]|uniref:Pkinase-domain-containing protein n=1 Tax=Mucor ambiguus TaxID=91626 RepID=A0A0C9M8C0_9FUNG|nr:pkinase-domain-containing protein [Mucor ambiguus]
MEVAMTAITITIMAAAATAVVALAIEKSEEIMEMIARVADMNEIEEAVVAIEIEAVIDGLHRRIEDPAKTETLNPAATAVVAIERPKADMIKTASTASTANDQPPTAPAAYYQHHPSQPQSSQPHQHHTHQQQQQQQQQHPYPQYQPLQLDPQQQQAAESAAWGNYYGWTVQDYNNAYSTNYTAEQYQQYIQHYYQSQDPNTYYGYYDASYYQQQQEIPQQQQQQQGVPPPPPPPPVTNVSSADSNALSLPSAHTQTHQLDQKDSYMGGVPEKVLDNVGYPCQTSEDPSTLFEKIGQVGEGTYGKVYKARNGKTGKLMALKRIRMKTEKDGFPITAMREIKLLQKLKHDRIVELQEIMVAKGSVYMVLEYMDHDLSGILGHPNFNFEPAHAKSLVKQMLEGLAYLHHMGILHRDIKGSNLLINNKGELKIADFGLARVFEKNRAHDYTNRVITLWYRPPELLLGATAYGPAVDIWSVGCIMLEFFTGKAVFNGQDEVSQIDSIYKIMGTPSVDTWPTLKELPWYEMVRPAENYVSKFRESYQSLLSPGALELSEALLSMDPLKRPTATQALEFSYFKHELPEPVMPANLLDINGDWHEFESKQRKKQKAPPPPPSNASTSKPNTNSKTSNNNNRTKATPSSALPSTRPH